MSVETVLDKIKNEFNKLNIESKPYSYEWIGEKISGINHSISGFLGNSALQLCFKSEIEAEEIYNFTKANPYIFNDIFALKRDNIVEVLLMPLSFRYIPRRDRSENDENPVLNLFNFAMNINKNNLNICINMGSDEDDLLPQLIKYSKTNIIFRKEPIILKIFNYNITDDNFENNVRNIVNTILFDINCCYEYAFETVSIETPNRLLIRKKRSRIQFPVQQTTINYKEYIPELIQYYNIAEKVDSIPFKYITYYHILEYFSDKSAYRIVQQEVKRLLTKPDYYLNENKYLTQVISIIKKESNRFLSDKIKVNRVLEQFINRSEILEFLKENEKIDYFGKEAIIKCNKHLKLPAIIYDNDNNFYDTLAKRIYSLRCSIVHSNPEFDEEKAIPFKFTPKNIEMVKTEILLLKKIAETIIIESKNIKP